MIRSAEAGIFLSLAVGAHLGVWALSPGMSGAKSAGGGGSQTVTISAASTAQAAMIERWQNPPDIIQRPASVLPATLERIDESSGMPRFAQISKAPSGLPAPALPVTPVMPDTFRIDTASAPPPTAAKPSNIRPVARPPRLQTATLSATQMQASKKAKGAARQKQKDDGGAAATSAHTDAGSNDLRAAWGAAIHAKIQRNMRYPRGARNSGTAKLALQVASNGALRGLKLTRSSGDAKLDEAALRAVSRAGRFEPAPRKLAGDVHAFSLSLTFQR